jgi:predicted small metal-binding protein
VAATVRHLRKSRRCTMRKKVDCRDYPSEMNCTLVIIGEEEEVVRAATEHAVSVHGHTDSPELREQIRSSLKNEMPQHA